MKGICSSCIFRLQWLHVWRRRLKNLGEGEGEYNEELVTDCGARSLDRNASFMQEFSRVRMQDRRVPCALCT